MLRNDRGIKLRDVSLYVSYSHMSEIERGVKSASPTMLEVIATGLGLTVPDFLREVSNYMEHNGYKEVHNVHRILEVRI